MKTSQYLAVYRDHATAKVKYYGPFVSQTMTETFLEHLPKPQLGGLKSWRLIAPYTHDEADIAGLALMSERLGTSEVEQIVNATKPIFAQLRRRAAA